MSAPAALSPRAARPCPHCGGRERDAGEPPADATFAQLLERYRLRAGISQLALGRFAGINASYVNRMESGEREAPTREVALALAHGLRLSVAETDRLLATVGYLPPSLQRLGNDSTVNAVVRALSDDRLTLEARADLRACIEAMCARWATGTPAARYERGGRA